VNNTSLWRYHRRAADACCPDVEIKIFPVHEELIVKTFKAFPYEAVG
jgi:hypothetical protein